MKIRKDKSKLKAIVINIEDSQDCLGFLLLGPADSTYHQEV